MREKLTFKSQLLLTIVVALLTLGHLIWDYFNGGVPTHHILADESLPGLSNWWGILLLPALTWLVVQHIRQRLRKAQNNNGLLKSISYRFLAALLFGITLSILFSLGTDLPLYMTLALFVVALFIPIYKAEFLLGYVLGTAFVLGAVIPIVAGLILAFLFSLIYKCSRFIQGLFKSELGEV